jgi:hypothetical protein
MMHPSIKKITFQPAPKTRAAQVVKIRLDEKDIATITEHLKVLDELSDNPRADIKDEIEFVVSQMIRNLRETGGWFGR